MNRRGALLVVVAGCTVAGLVWLAWWVMVSSQRESTDNAYVAGHQVQIVPQITGTVVAVRFEDTQWVKQGDVLVELDPSDALVACEQARAALEQTVRHVRQLEHAVRMNDAIVNARSLEWTQAQEDFNRQLPLRDTGAIAPQSLSHSARQVSLAHAALLAARAQAAGSRDMVDGAPVADQPDIRAARAAYVEAWLGLHRTRIVAPVSGTIVQRTVQLGYRVQPGLALMRIVPTDQVWIDANFKEVQLRNVRIGQPATVAVDLYGSGTVLKGRVAGVSPGTGSAFALLPPQNAAGNWVKVVQRVAVRIELEGDAATRHPLLIGLSAHASVDTHDRSGPAVTETRTAAGAALPSMHEPGSAILDTDAYSQDSAAGQAAADRIIVESLRRTNAASL